MENQKIKHLQNELESLTNRFNENMKRISNLFKYTNQEGMLKERLPELESMDKAISERLKLIKENFQINWERVDVIRQIKETQKDVCSLENIGIPSKNNTLCGKGFFEKWRKEYESREDFLMVEIIDILNN